MIVIVRFMVQQQKVKANIFIYVKSGQALHDSTEWVYFCLSRPGQGYEFGGIN